MKCREKNSDKTFLKIDNTEAFWEKLKETKVRVIQISESGIIVSDGLCKYYAGFGEFLIISNDSRIEVCCEEEFNRRYEVIDVKADILGDAVKELNDYIKQFADELKKIKDIIPKFNINNEAADSSDMIKNLKEGLSEILKV
jgi:hypothetical protein